MAGVASRRAASDPLRNFRFVVVFAKQTYPQGTDPQHGGRPGDFLARGGFMRVAGIGVQTEAIPYREGGYNTTTHKLPGQSDFPPMTFSRGMFDFKFGGGAGPAAWQWMKELFHHSQGTGPALGTDRDFRTNVKVYLLDHPRSEWSQEAANGQVKLSGAGGNLGTVNARVRVTAYNAWPTSVVFSDLDAGGNSIMVEQMTLVHEGLDVEWANSDAGIPVGS